MLIKEMGEIEASLKRIKKISRGLSYGSKFAIAVFSILFASVIALIAFGDSSSSLISKMALLAPLCLYALATMILLVIMHGIFESISKGDTPFTSAQVSRFRWAALVLLLGAVVETVFSSGALSIAQTDSMVVNYYDSSAGSNTPSINLASILGAALLFALSFVFEYGVILQEFTDDTL